jgi:hypothetical protein
MLWAKLDKDKPRNPVKARPMKTKGKIVPTISLKLRSYGTSKKLSQEIENSHAKENASQLQQK